MIQNILLILFMTVLVAIVRSTGWHTPGLSEYEASLLFGFILLVSYLSGKISQRGKLPQITGYLLAGIVFGPHILGAINPSFTCFSDNALSQLSVFNQLALGLIALSAGGELKLEHLKPRMRSILWVIVVQTLVVFILVIGVIFLSAPHIAFLKGFDNRAILGMALLLSVMANTKSPASTIPLILEYRAKGPLTTMVLGVTVFKDVLVIVLFSFSLIVSKSLMGVQDQGGFSLVVLLLWEVLGSLGGGIVLGYLLGLYTKRIGHGLPLVLVALSYLCLKLAGGVHLSGLLLCMTAGFYVVNFTKHGNMLIASLEQYSLPIYVLFFTITGAGLDLSMLLPMWPFVTILVVIRILAIWIGTTAGSVLANDSPPVRKYGWTGFVTQAGVTLGLALVMENAIPQVGPYLRNVVVAGVAVNQIIGPIAFRYGLLRSGEGKISH